MLVPAGARKPPQPVLFGSPRSGPRRLFAHVSAARNLDSLIIKRFDSSEPWVSPAITILDVRGAGAPGKPATGGDVRWRVMEDYQSFYNDSDGVHPGQVRTQVVSAGWFTSLEAAQNQPADYDEFIYYEWGNERIHHDYYREEYITGTPADNGASATAFGLTFPGGDGGPASETKFNGVIILPKNSYSIIVPSGGFIEVSYSL